jgi:hypothetical protein
MAGITVLHFQSDLDSFAARSLRSCHHSHCVASRRDGEPSVVSDFPVELLPCRFERVELKRDLVAVLQSVNETNVHRLSTERLPQLVVSPERLIELSDTPPPVCRLA